MALERSADLFDDLVRQCRDVERGPAEGGAARPPAASESAHVQSRTAIRGAAALQSRFCIVFRPQRPDSFASRASRNRRWLSPSSQSCIGQHIAKVHAALAAFAMDRQVLLHLSVGIRSRRIADMRSHSGCPGRLPSYLHVAITSISSSVNQPRPRRAARAFSGLPE